MNLYFLVEGIGKEMEFYPLWISFLLPQISRVDRYNQVINNNYYIACSYGNSSIYGNKHLKGAIENINEFGNYNYLIICTDGDEVGIDKKREEIYNYLISNKLTLTNCQLEIMIQNPCIETWLMGNQKIYPTEILNKGFEKYHLHYNVSIHDPELMEKMIDFRRSKSKFHFNYLVEMVKLPQKIFYSGSKPPQAMLTEQYFTQMQKRITETPTHLPSFQSFLQFCTKINDEISK